MEMENLRNFVILQFRDDLEIVNKNWIIDDNTYFYPVGVKNRNDYFKLLNTMVRPGYHNDKYNWLPHYTTKIYDSEDMFGKAMSKLALIKYYNNSIGEADFKKSCNEYVNKYYPTPVPPEKLNSQIFENKKNNSAPVSRLLKFLTPIPCSMNQKPTTDPFKSNDSVTTIVGIEEFSAGNLNKNVPTTFTQSSTTTINYCSKKDSDVPVSKLSTCNTPSYGSTKCKPFNFPLKSTASTKNLSGGTIKENKPATFTQNTTFPNIKNNLIPQLSMSVPSIDVLDQTNILYKKIVYFEQIIMGINLRITKSLDNQEKIISLIEEETRKTLAEKYVNKVTEEFEDHFNSNFPLKTFDDILELEKLLIQKQYYKLLKTKLLSYSGADLKSMTINILTKLFTNNVAAKIMLSGSNIKRPLTLDTMYKIKFQNKIIYKLVIDVLMQKFKCNEDQIKVPIRSWLKHAKENNEVEHSKN